MTLEEDALTTWLVEYLEANTELMSLLNGGVNIEVRPTSEGASPFVRVDKLDGDDVIVIGGHRVWADMTYHVRGVEHWRGSGHPDRTEVNAIGARLDALLHWHEATTATHSIHGFREEPEPMPMTTEGDGSLWLQSGGVYRIRAAAT